MITICTCIAAKPSWLVVKSHRTHTDVGVGGDVGGGGVMTASVKGHGHKGGYSIGGRMTICR